MARAGKKKWASRGNAEKKKEGQDFNFPCPFSIPFSATLRLREASVFPDRDYTAEQTKRHEKNSAYSDDSV